MDTSKSKCKDESIDIPNVMILCNDVFCRVVNYVQNIVCSATVKCIEIALYSEGKCIAVCYEWGFSEKWFGH